MVMISAVAKIKCYYTKKIEGEQFIQFLQGLAKSKVYSFIHKLG